MHTTGLIYVGKGRQQRTSVQGTCTGDSSTVVCLLCNIDIALSPAHSHIFNVTALKTWEWPVEKATIGRHYDDVDKD